MKKLLLIPFILVCLNAFMVFPEEVKTTKDTKKRKIHKFEIEGLTKKEKNKLKLFLRIPRLIKLINKGKSLSRNTMGFRKRISSLLKRAEKLSGNESEKKYLKSLSADILKMKFITSFSAWLDMRDNQAEVILYQEPKSRELVGFIWINKNFATGIINKLSDNLGKILSKSGWKNDFIRITPDLFPPFILSNLIYPEKLGSINLVHPPQKLKKKQFGFKTIFFQNIMKENFNQRIKPLSSSVFSKIVSNRVDYEFFLAFQIIHRVCHYLGPIMLLGKTKEIEFVYRKLKDLYYPVEELRADALTFLVISILSEEKIFDKNWEKGLYYTIVANLINRLINISDNDFKDPNLLFFNYLFKNECVKYDINKKQLSLSTNKIIKNIKPLLAKLNRITENGNYQEAEKFLNYYGYIPDHLKEIIKILSKMPDNDSKD